MNLFTDDEPRDRRDPPLRDDVPGAIRPCVIADLEGTPLADASDRPLRRDRT